MKINSYRNKKDGAVRSYDMKNPKNRAICTGFYICCIILALICLFPAFWVFAGSFKDIKEFTRSEQILPEVFDIGKLIQAWKKMKFASYFINSGIVVAGCCFFSVLINGLTAYGIAILKPKGYRIFYTLIMLCLIVPSTGSVIALYVNINRIGLSGSFIPLWLAAGANAFNVVLFKQFFVVIGSCEIIGSSDSSIKNAKPNDIGEIISQTKIKKIYLNGKTAEKYYIKYIKRSVSTAYACLPSTSPANAAYSFEDLISAWSEILK